MSGGPLVPILHGFIQALQVVRSQPPGSQHRQFAEFQLAGAFSTIATIPVGAPFPYEVRRDAFLLLADPNVAATLDQPTDSGFSGLFNRVTNQPAATPVEPFLTAMRLLVEVRLSFIAPTPSPLGAPDPDQVIQALDHVITVVRTLPAASPEAEALREVSERVLRAEVSFWEFNHRVFRSVTTALPLLDDAVRELDRLLATLERVPEVEAGTRYAVIDRRNYAMRSRLMASGSLMAPPPMGKSETWIAHVTEWYDFESQRHADLIAHEAQEHQRAVMVATGAGDSDPAGYATAYLERTRVESETALINAELRVAEAKLGAAVFAGDLDAFDQANTVIDPLYDSLRRNAEDFGRAQIDARRLAGFDFSVHTATDEREDLERIRHAVAERATVSQQIRTETRIALAAGDTERAISIGSLIVQNIDKQEVTNVSKFNVQGDNHGFIGENSGNIGAVGQGASASGGVGDGPRVFNGPLNGLDSAMLAKEIRAVRDALALKPEDAEVLAEAEEAAEKGDEPGVVAALKKMAGDVWDEVVVIGSALGLAAAKAKLGL